ncbi:DUF6215 domain-containing protein [Streptomyces sp. NPDC048224]|uniref:DUF6215 domain-containing protein n=1 Tax=Streptomyces sp. NPDC048224 TaxID=3154500 RepID=UPI0033D2681A
MFGLIVRLLPFWIREPLLVVVGSVFGVRLMYLALHDGEWVPAAIGAAFLLFTAVRVHTVIQALRARRHPAPAASADSTAPDADGRPQPEAQAQPQVPAQQPPAPAVQEKEPNAWGQAAAAIAVFAALAAALWLGPELMPSDAHGTPQDAASCPTGEDEPLPSAYTETSRAVTGDDLCKALNRTDLPRLLGTPAETAMGASASSGTAPLTDGRVAQPEAKVEFDTYTVDVSATYNDLSIAQYVKLMEFGEETDVEKLKVLGRPAVLSSDHTMRFEIDLGGGGSGGPVEQGPLARTLSVALGAKDPGGYCEITVWSEAGALPDDAALLDIAEKILPAIPERTA